MDWWVGMGAEKGIRYSVFSIQAGTDFGARGARFFLLVHFQVETNYPRPSGDATDPVRIGRQSAQAASQAFDD